MSETLEKLYLELARMLPPEVRSCRDIIADNRIAQLESVLKNTLDYIKSHLQGVNIPASITVPIMNVLTAAESPLPKPIERRYDIQTEEDQRSE